MMTNKMVLSPRVQFLLKWVGAGEFDVLLEDLELKQQFLTTSTVPNYSKAAWNKFLSSLEITTSDHNQPSGVTLACTVAHTP